MDYPCIKRSLTKMTISVGLACFARGSVAGGLSAGSIIMKQLAESTVLHFLKSRGCFLSSHECVYFILAFQRLPEGCVVV